MIPMHPIAWAVLVGGLAVIAAAVIYVWRADRRDAQEERHTMLEWERITGIQVGVPTAWIDLGVDPEERISLRLFRNLAELSGCRHRPNRHPLES